MDAQLADSSLSTVENTVLYSELHKAWHLLALLLRIGRPVHPAELASQCHLIRVPPDYVEYLCSIPNSPIYLTNNRFVTPSLAAFVAFQKLASNLTAIDSVVPRIKIEVIRPKRIWEDVVRTYCRRRKRGRSEFEVPQVMRKRALLQSADEDETRIVSISPNGTPSDCTEVYFPGGDGMNGGTDTQASDISTMKLGSDNLSRVVGEAPFLVNLNAGVLSCGLKNIDCKSSMETSMFEHMMKQQYVYTTESKFSFQIFERLPPIPCPITIQKIKALLQFPERSILTPPIDSLVVWTDSEMGRINFTSSTCFNAPSCIQEEHSTILPVEAENVGHAGKANNTKTVLDGVVIRKEEKLLIDSNYREGEIEYVVPAIAVNTLIMEKCIDVIPSLDREKTTAKVENQDELWVCEKPLMISSSKSMISQKDSLNQPSLCDALGDSKAVSSPIEQLQCSRNRNTISMKQKLKQKCDKKIQNLKTRENSKDKRDKFTAVALNNQREPRPVPNFESFTVEEEEGSGGYGTVYRARRKKDGATFAIKCPHANANRHHVYNELKMLERFGGKNFVIKYEGSFKSENSECLVLEHVEHDRPEVLKREIDVYQLQWYGYCMFRALAGLHKQGIVHRDIKPGNFLFSRKINKGYLIDFNLAVDLPRKYGTIDKSKVGFDLSFTHAPLVHAKSLPPTNKQFVLGKTLGAINQDAQKVSKPTLLPTNVKKKVVDQTNLGSRNLMKSQGADGSGITSAKDTTSARTPSTERLREPIPCQGRKELISLVHKAMQSPNYEAHSSPASKRKRIAAVPGKVDRKRFCLTPMPLYSSSIAVAGAGLVKTKGDGKQKREGPCVGTKGFRAPEVLFRSPHQGPKVDIWSAGVTLLYLMIGRTPFAGEPEENIKEIAKLRGNEDLWEVAKIHNSEPSFPADLYDFKFLLPMRLRDWCKQNTRRPEFFELLPRSLVDLVDKCLTVNPRLRLSAEEALRHEFFAPCHEELRKERLVRKGLSLGPGIAHLSHRESETCEVFS